VHILTDVIRAGLANMWTSSKVFAAVIDVNAFIIQFNKRNVTLLAEIMVRNYNSSFLR
jgi:hypothetical protein